MARWWCRPLGTHTRRRFEEHTNTSFYPLVKLLQSTAPPSPRYVETIATVFMAKVFKRQLIMISVVISIVISIVIGMMTAILMNIVIIIIIIIIIALVVLRCLGSNHFESKLDPESDLKQISCKLQI